MNHEQQAEWGRLVARANRPIGTIDQPVGHELILSIDKNMRATDDLIAEIRKEVVSIHKTMVLLKARS